MPRPPGQPPGVQRASTAAAVPRGADGRSLVRRIARAREAFLSSARSSGLPSAATQPDAVRAVVAESWRRSLGLGVDPLRWEPPLDLEGSDLEAYRSQHPLASVMPVVRTLLVDQAADAGLIVAVADVEGRLLWVEGASDLRRRAEAMRFVEGARWSEDVAGTNAPGTSLALGAPVQIFAAEHLGSPVTPWSCTAAPVHGPDGSVLGAIDVTGGDDVAGVATLLLVRATAAAVEAELRSASAVTARDLPAQRRRSRAVRRRRRVEVLAGACRLVADGRALPLRLRHAELIVLLRAQPRGLTVDQLACLLTEQQTAAVTVRADLSRLRAALAAVGVRLTPSPYRLEDALDTDDDEVRRHLTAGAVRDALDAYPGPLLPASSAPGVEELRRRLADEVRAGVLASRDIEALWTYANRPDGADDIAAWDACTRLLPPGTPRAILARTRFSRLDAELGV